MACVQVGQGGTILGPAGRPTKTRKCIVLQVPGGQIGGAKAFRRVPRTRNGSRQEIMARVAE